MTYVKPEIAELGDAVTVIQGKQGGMIEGSFSSEPAYELDEE